MNVALGLLAVFLLTLATGYFVAQEFAYVTADRLALSQRAAGGDRKAARAVKVMERLSFMLSGAQLGITVTTLVVGFIAKPALAELIAPALGAAGVPEGATGGIALGLGFGLATVVQMVLGELAPKNLALARPEPLARALASSTLVYLTIAGPVIRLFDTAANRLLRAVGIEPVEELHHGATLEELGHIIGESEAYGHLPGDQADLLERALAFSDHTAEEVMVPRVEVVTVAGSARIPELDELIARHGHTHYPVLGDSLDDVIGIVSLRELVTVPLDKAADTKVTDVAREVLVVPFSASLPDLVLQMHARGEEVACVVDEHGGLAGLATWEDVAEELVGEIADENDLDIPTAVRKDGGWEIDAALRVDEVALATGLELPDEDDYDTVGGLVLQRLGRFAVPGDVVTVGLVPDMAEHAPTHVEIEVLTLDRHVPERVGLRPVRRAEEDRESGEEK
ncbi:MULTISPECIES: hemolysin family protein [Streptosporangium]|uniref:CBS domain containing-hemolysin-like protein n=1 Tax=Streptosporangium brasiliense TaxID=47480 RepID=A0ABT9RER0_9ACTN|nr:hemolysin family protein [Streptosporangium brasiliense]MDP9867746.1 CBS domain containing-hemolysin-like protein [Streptosporangium brasiliense]